MWKVEAVLTASESINGATSAGAGPDAEEIITAKNPILDERRSRVLDLMFGEEPPHRSVVRPKQLCVAPELVAELHANDTSPQPCLSVDVSWEVERQQSTDFARWFIGNSSPPFEFVSAVSELESHLRIAIAKQGSPMPKRDLDRRVRAARNAVSEMLRFINKSAPSHKNKEDQADKWSRAIGLLRGLIVDKNDKELLERLFQDEIIRFRCDDIQFDACLRIVNQARTEPTKNLSATMMPDYGDRFVADLKWIDQFAKTYLSKKFPKRGAPKKIRVAEVSSNKRKTWSAELICAVIVSAAIAWLGRSFVLPCS